MPTIFDTITKADVVHEPFPYVMKKNALDPALADRLLAAYPSLKHLASGAQGFGKHESLPNNIKIRYMYKDMMEDTTLPEVWRDFVNAHTTYTFYKKFFTLFEDDLKKIYPHLLGAVEDMRPEAVGVKGIDNCKTKKFLLNPEICADSPVTKPSSARSLHIDDRFKFGVALLYLRSSENDSVGGEFNIYRHKGTGSFVMNHIRIVKPRYQDDFELVAQIPYEHNTLALFFNTPYAFHGVSPREKTQHPRHVFNVAFDFCEPLFDLGEHTESPLIAKLRALYMRATGTHKELVR